MERTNKTSFKNLLLAILMTRLLVPTAHAGGPMWTFTPRTATTVAVPPGTTDSVQYTVTNQSSRPKKLMLLPTSGLSQGGDCNLAPKGSAGSSCILTININGSNIPAGGIQSGPKICQANANGSANPNQCYQPSKANALHIVKLPNLTIGQPFQGGVVACLNGGKNNLIAATVDNNNGNTIIWGIFATTGATSTTDGATNTQTIVDCLTNGAGACAGGIDVNTYAAGICSTYEVDDQGNTPCVSGNTCYDDWFLPASPAVGGIPSSPTSQLDCLWFNRAAIGGFANVVYWSSTELNANFARLQDFFNGARFGGSKDLVNRVRCVRAFTP
ncbi:hypothetical protein [Legionella sp. W05-934-2]|uniref:hypothetical protein n=1 Tax=Legionella sp. W05-934-2 TaxID=1198649 RepID=UPI0034637B68